MQHKLKLQPPDDPSVLPFADYAYPVSTKSWNKLVLVGEAPGAEEARQGHPFVGRSGQLLDKILVQSGIDRAQCLIANVFRRQPPSNKIDYFFASRRIAVLKGIMLAEEYGKFGSVFCRASFASDIDYLRDVLQQQRPSCIVALGRTPLWALTGENGLLNKVGQLLPCRLVPTIPVIATFHPSFILRGNWKLQNQWLMHFQTALKYV